MNISVVVATYNGVDYLGEQLESILNQTIVPDEVIITDDSSDDGTIKLARDYQSNHPNKIDVIKNNSNLGVTKNFEQGINKATGDVIFLCDQDDIWYENKIEKQIAAFEQNSGSLVFHNAEVVDESLDHIGDHWKNIGYKPGTTAEPKKALLRLICGNYVKGSSIMIDSALRDEIIPIPEYIGYDWYIAIIALLLSGVIEIDEKLQKWRLHEAQVSSPRPVSNSCPETFLRRVQQGIESKRNAGHYRKQTAKWASLEQSITDIKKEQLSLEKEFAIKLVQDRYRYERNRAIIHDKEAGPLQSFPALFSNLLSKRYTRYGNAPSFLYALKDGFYAL